MIKCREYWMMRVDLVISAPHQLRCDNNCYLAMDYTDRSGFYPRNLRLTLQMEKTYDQPVTGRAL